MKKLLLAFLVVAGLCLVPAQVVLAWGPFDGPCDKASVSSESAVCNNRSQANNTISGAGGILSVGTNLLAMVTGVAAVITIIISGIRFITSDGDPSSINAARNTLLFAVIGLVVVVAARSIIVFVINRVYK